MIYGVCVRINGQQGKPHIFSTQHATDTSEEATDQHSLLQGKLNEEMLKEFFSSHKYYDNIEVTTYKRKVWDQWR